jgi:hypothetical protein
MFDIVGTLLWVSIGVGGLALAFAEYAWANKNRRNK